MGSIIYRQIFTERRCIKLKYKITEIFFLNEIFTIFADKMKRLIKSLKRVVLLGHDYRTLIVLASH